MSSPRDTFIYKGGVADDLDDSDFDDEAIKLGIEVELEHTSNDVK